MPGVQLITGRAGALDRRDVDTDQIIPASWPSTPVIRLCCPTW